MEEGEAGEAGEESVEVDAGKVDPCSIEGLEVWGEEGVDRGEVGGREGVVGVIEVNVEVLGTGENGMSEERDVVVVKRGEDAEVDFGRRAKEGRKRGRRARQVAALKDGVELRRAGK